TENNIKKMAVKAYKALNMRDYARIDFRLNEDNIPYVLEINSLPGLMKCHSDLCKMAGAARLNYDGLVMKIVNNAVKRYGLDENENMEISKIIINNKH